MAHLRRIVAVHPLDCHLADTGLLTYFDSRGFGRARVTSDFILRVPMILFWPGCSRCRWTVGDGKNGGIRLGCI